MPTTNSQALFLMYDQNRAFLQDGTGKVYSPVEDVKNFILLVALLDLILVCFLGWYSWQWWQLGVGYAIALLLLWVGGCYLPHYYHKRIQTILTQGQVVIGYVLTTVGRAEDNGYKVAVTYEFMAPTGQRIKGHSAEIRNDLTAKTLPAAKTAVAVLYVSANDFFLL